MRDDRERQGWSRPDGDDDGRATQVRIGVPLVTGTDPVALAFLDRLVHQANAELKLSGDPRGLEVVRLATEPGTVRLWGGSRVQVDALFREAPGLDVLVLVGPPEAEATPARDEEAVLGYLRKARGDVQHVLATGEGVRWAMETGLSTGRRVVVNHLAPALRARYDATLAAASDPARDGDLWSASDPPRFLLMLLEFFAELGGFKIPDRIQVRMPWVAMLLKAFVEMTQPDEDDEGGIAIETDTDQ